MPYHLSLSTAGLIVGLLSLTISALAILKQPAFIAWLRRLPRAENLGIAILTIDLAWVFWLVAVMDMGEFATYRTHLLVLLPIFYGLTLKFVDDFLAVRAIGVLLLLMAEPILTAAFLRPEISRLLLVVAAYAWIIKGIFFVGMPYLMRDGIAWMTRSTSRWTALWAAGLVYGVVVLLFTFTAYQG